MQFIGLLPFFPVRSHPPNTTNGLKGRWPRILFLTPARNLIVQLMFELNVWNCVIFAGINVSWCTGKTLLKSHVIGILDIEFIFLPIQFPSLLPGVFPAPILHSHKWLETSLALGLIFDTYTYQAVLFSSYFRPCVNTQLFWWVATFAKLVVTTFPPLSKLICPPGGPSLVR